MASCSGSTRVVGIIPAGGAREALGAGEGAFPPTFHVRTLAALVEDVEVVVEDGGDDGHHVCLDDTRAHGLGAADANVDDALEGEVPLPHLHHVLAAALLEDADEALDAAIDGENVAYAAGGGGEVGEVVEGVDEGEGGGAVEGAAVVEGGGDADGGFVGVGDAEVDFPHDCDGV